MNDVRIYLDPDTPLRVAPDDSWDRGNYLALEFGPGLTVNVPYPLARRLHADMAPHLTEGGQP